MLQLQTLPACDSDDPFADTVGKVAGFSLHAGVATKAHERDKLERLCQLRDFKTASEGKNWLEMDVEQGNIQARATEFSKFSQRSGRKARRTAAQ